MGLLIGDNLGQDKFEFRSVFWPNRDVEIGLSCCLEVCRFGKRDFGRFNSTSPGTMTDTTSEDVQATYVQKSEWKVARVIVLISCIDPLGKQL